MEFIWPVADDYIPMNPQDIPLFAKLAGGR